jgi:hypothetical protein
MLYRSVSSSTAVHTVEAAAEEGISHDSRLQLIDVLLGGR